MSTELEARRAAVITGLRELAQFIEDHPDLPMPRYGFNGLDINVGLDVDISKDDDAGCRAVVDAAAAVLGREPVTTPGGHYEVERRFSGDIGYEVLYIPQKVMDEYQLRTSYEDNIMVGAL